MLGIGLGVLTGQVNDLPAPDRRVGAELVEGYDDNALIGDPGVFTVIGGLGWIVAVIAAAIALRGVGAPLSAAVFLGLSSIVAAHPPPFGPVGLAFFIVAVVILVRAQAVPRAAPSPVG